MFEIGGWRFAGDHFLHGVGGAWSAGIQSSVICAPSPKKNSSICWIRQCITSTQRYAHADDPLLDQAYDELFNRQGLSEASENEHLRLQAS